MEITFLPPYEFLKDGIESSADNSTVKMSRELFRMLIAAAAKATAFDPDWYRAEYFDVAEAIEAGLVDDELDHFASSGYEEGRSPAYFEVDEAWYLETYPDVAEAVAAGDLSAEDHYNTVGVMEGRARDPDTEYQAQRWAAVITESAELVHPAPVPAPVPEP